MNNSTKRIYNELIELHDINDLHIINYDFDNRVINIFYDNNYIDIYYYNSYPFSNINKIFINNKSYSDILREKNDNIIKNSKKIANNKKLINRLNIKFKHCCLFCSSLINSENWSPIIKIKDYLNEIKNLNNFEKNYLNFIKLKHLYNTNILCNDILFKIEKYLDIEVFKFIFD